MTSEELQRLFENSMRRTRELEAKHESGQRLTKRDCMELQKMNERLHLIGRELLLLVGSDDPQFDCFRQPHVKQKLPVCFGPLDLSERQQTEVH